MTFKFTRGAIKLNLGKLEHFNKSYRDALLGSPVPELADEEARLVDSHLVQPMLRQLGSITSGSAPSDADKLPQAWQGDLQLVPALASSDDPAQAAYIRNILASRQGGYQSPGSLIQQHPYLFWRVPASLYKASLRAGPAPDERILDALQAALESPRCWDGQGGEVMSRIRDGLQGQAIDQVVLHDTLRLVAAGGQGVVSQSSPNMFKLLGGDEWRHRLDAVRAAMRDTS